MPILFELLPGFTLNLTTALILVLLIYVPSGQGKNRKEYTFTFFTFNILIYFISILLRDVQLSVGFGFGLFAIFSTLRYRTDPMPVKEMTYLFTCITLPVMNTLFMATRISYAELAIINTFVIVFIFLLEQQWNVRQDLSKEILYEKIELIKPENRAALLADLRERTGLMVKYCVVKRIDFLRDTAQLSIYYESEEPWQTPSVPERPTINTNDDDNDDDNDDFFQTLQSE